MTITTINPATGEPIKTYVTQSDSEVRTIIEQSQAAFLSWRQMSFQDRKEPLQQLSRLLLANKERYAKLITEEMGKPITQAIPEVEKCALSCDFYAAHAETFLQTEIVKTNNTKSYVSYVPLGIIFAIMPWNFPFWQVFRCAAPTLMAGNALILKHAPCVTGCALLLQELFIEAGFPPHLFTSLVMEESLAGVVIKHPHVKAVTLTGSPKAGRAVGAIAAQALKKMVLESGGSDPYLILKDADIDQAALCCVQSRLNNTGQVCVAAKRFIVVKEIQTIFRERVLSLLSTYVSADPLNPSCLLGPLAREDLREVLHRQVQESVAKGALLLIGGYLPEGKGFFYPVTVLANVKPGMPAYEEELFGPVIAFIDANDEAEAIRIANDTIYGLGAAVFTKDISRGESILLNELEMGVGALNRSISSDLLLPFGGVKASGYGRELSVQGIREFTNIKTLMVA